MEKVVVVSYNFPPVGGAGVQRPVKFVKYLPEYGWHPVVVSVANPSVPVTDHSLLKDIPDGVRVYRCRTLEPSYQRKLTLAAGSRQGLVPALKRRLKKLVSQLLLPDPQLLWWPGLFRETLRVVKTEKPRCLMVSAPPFSSFVPVVLAGRLAGVPVVLDYRDEWTFSRNTWENATKGGLASLVDRVLEGLVLRYCSGLTTANGSYLASLRASYPQCAGTPSRVITNGYDADDLVDELPAAAGDATLRFVYTGTVWAATSFAPFAAALDRLLAETPELAERLFIQVIGRVLDTEIACLTGERLARVVALRGYLDHERLAAEVAAADVLLLTLSPLPGAEKIITGKVFEYMASGKHIFAVIPAGETREILERNYDNFTLVDPDDPAAILRELKALPGRLAELRGRKGRGVPQFLRRNLTAQLAELFDQVAGAASGGGR